MAERKSLTILLVLLAGIMLPMMSGCYAPSSRTSADMIVIDDSLITTMVKAKLYDTKELKGFAIAVETDDSIVTLTGAVDTQEQKMLAEDVTRSVREVRSVRNLLINK